MPQKETPGNARGGGHSFCGPAAVQVVCLFVTQVGQNWNQLVTELYQWQRFGKMLEVDKVL